MQKYINTWNSSRENVLMKENHFLIHKGVYPCDDGIPAIHNHIFTEIEFIAGGSCIQTINGHNLECEDGTIFLMFPQDVHQYSQFNGNVTVYSLCFADDMLSKEVVDVLYSKNCVLHAKLSDKSYDHIKLCFDKLISENTKPQFLSSYIIRGLIQEIVIEILRHGDPAKIKIGNPALRDSLFYIRENFKHQLSLESVSQKAHLTPQYFCKLFKQELNISFHEYLRNTRLDYAMMLLKTTDMNVTEICIESGFNSASNFTKIFKTRFGTTPKQLRSSK